MFSQVHIHFDFEEGIGIVDKGKEFLDIDFSFCTFLDQIFFVHDLQGYFSTMSFEEEVTLD
jgi:hypothetical protein